jgi:hypothetical protein
MSQYDASATPMYNAFHTIAVAAPFVKRDARVRLDEMNRPAAPGAAASALMNFVEADRAPELELNEILWWSVRGIDSHMPPPVHAAFIRPVKNADGDGDDDDWWDRIKKHR